MAATERPSISKKQAVQDYLATRPDASAKEVIEALKQQGLDVAEATIYNVKWANNRASSTDEPQQDATVSVAAIASDPAPPATVAVNKTQAVKDYLASRPKATPLQISAALGAQGIDVAPNYAAGIKSNLKAKKRKKKAASKTASPVTEKSTPATTDDQISLDALRKAKALIQELGGLDQAKQALKALATLLD